MLKLAGANLTGELTSVFCSLGRRVLFLYSFDLFDLFIHLPILCSVACVGLLNFDGQQCFLCVFGDLMWRRIP